ncbi:hypothetical protein MC885_001307 [Smutsia gigantea]|nr:hypothetical protein MC885_001307 [Smutsia gigantea]
MFHWLNRSGSGASSFPLAVSRRAGRDSRGSAPAVPRGLGLRQRDGSAGVQPLPLTSAVESPPLPPAPRLAGVSVPYPDCPAARSRDALPLLWALIMETKRVEIPGSVLDDLCSRFILHIPSEERDNAIRVCFQIELAHWFYLDFYMQNTPGLPQCGIRDFAKADILFITVTTVFLSC